MFFLVKNKCRLLLFYCFLLAGSFVFSQDSLKKYSYKELSQLAFDNENNKEKLAIYLKAFYNRSIQEKTTERLTEYYRDFIFLQPEDKRKELIDSALYYANLTENYEIIGKTYLTKGVYSYNMKDFEEALDSYLKGYDYISQTDNDYLKNKTKYHIGVIKNYLGNYDEAIDFFTECSLFFASKPDEYNYQKGYITSSEGLAWAYTKTGQFNKSKKILQSILHLIQKTNISSLDEKYIIFKQGINHYFAEEYAQCIEKIEQTLPIIYDNEDFAWGSIGELYIAKSYWNSGQESKAIPHLLQIDKVFTEKKYTHPDLREAYELLIKYYESLRDRDKQLYYTNRLIEVDKVYNTTYKFLSKQIYKDYDTKDLLRAKNDLEIALYLQTNRTKIIISVFVLAITLLSITYFVNSKRSRERARELIRRIENLESIMNQKAQPETELEPQKPRLIVTDELAQTILAKLQRLEDKDFYLKRDITLSKLAKKLDTNSSYLSAVINTYKNKNFAAYLNELRINYIAKEILRIEPYELQKYSLDAFAEMAGYANVRSFSDAFQKELSVKPSVYIKEVIKRNQVALVA